jgi:hypothetical protein
MDNSRGILDLLRSWSTPPPRWILVVLCAACSDTRHVYQLATELRREFTPIKVGVMLTDGVILTVTVADSALVVSSCETQVGVAMRVGRFLRDHDSRVDSLLAVNVAFAPGTKDAPLPARPHAHLPIRFNPARVAAGLAASDSTSAVSSCKAFEELNEDHLHTGSP